MPIVRIEISEGLSHEAKASIAKSVTKAISHNANVAPEKVIIFFTDVARSNQSVGGEMRAHPS